MTQTFGIKTVTLEVIQPSTGPVCPGQEIILTCTVTQTGTVIELLLNWRNGSTTARYEIANQQSGPISLDSFVTTAVFMIITNNSAVIVSNATLTSAIFSNNNTTISCLSPPQDNSQTTTIIVAGQYSTCVYGLTNKY